MSYSLTLDQFINRKNTAKEMTVLALLKEGLISKENADYFLENYVIVEQDHTSWGERIMKIFKGTGAEGTIKFRIVKNIDIWDENKQGAKPRLVSGAKLIAIKKEKEPDAGAERFQDLGDNGGETE